MMYAFTITTNRKYISKDKQKFIDGFLLYLQHEQNIDVRQLEFNIESAKTMGYHAHGVLSSFLTNIKGSEFFIYIKELKDDNDLLQWRNYMHKDTYAPAMLLDP